MQAKVMLYTPRFRLYGRAFLSVHAMRVAYGAPLWSFETQHAHMRGVDPVSPAERRDSGGNRAILAQYEEARMLALAHDFTHLLTVEDDMVIPPDALTRLLGCDAGVAYGLYCWRWGDHRWSAYRYVLSDSGESWASDAPHLAAEYLAHGRRVAVAGLGLGCTLIRRDVLKAIPFRLPENAQAANDWYFALDCQERGIDQVCDFGVVCGHMTMLPSPRIIYPTINDLGFADSRVDLLDIPIP